MGLEPDLKRNRIALSMKCKVDLDNRRSDSGTSDNGPRPQGNSANFNSNTAQNNDWLSQALQNARKKLSERQFFELG